jgi:hydrogenase maturation factor
MRIGKIDKDTFDRFILRRLGRKDATVIVPSRTGIDAGVIDAGRGKVLVIAEDPIFTMPKLPQTRYGRRFSRDCRNNKTLRGNMAAGRMRSRMNLPLRAV